jgi:hypothetical protein
MDKAWMLGRGMMRRGVVFGVAVASVWTVTAAQPLQGAPNDAETPIPETLRYYEPVREKVAPEKLSVDLCVYGGTSAGVIAAVQAARDGRSVVLVAPESHLGGLTTGGLTYTDFGNKASIGGLSREFYQRVGKKYGLPEEWKFEPRVAEQVYEEMIAEAKVPVRMRHFLKSVKRKGQRLTSLTTERGLTVNARMFIDATYEGDLMAKAKVSYTVGRESNDQYGETLNGVQVRDKHQFEFPVSPYVVEGDPKSGLLPGIEPEPVKPNGTGDHRVQAYNFRLTLTKDPKNRLPFPKPEGYDPREYELLARYIKHDTKFLFGKYDLLQNGKYDKNNHGAISTDYIGQNYGWPEGDYKTREKIFRKHVIYQQGLMWFLTNDPRVPADVRARLAEWGLCRDEFVDTAGWSRQLYIREARRMVSDYVVTEHDCRGTRRAPDSVGMGSYGMDSHNCQRVVIDGAVKNEGDVQVGGFAPYPISYRAIVPRRGECENLLVPVCVSSSHIAFGSVRMEPVFMLLAQSAAVAAGFAMDTDCSVQDVDYSRLRARLLELGQVLEWTGPVNTGRVTPIPPSSLPGIVLDDADGVKTGEWHASSIAHARKVGTGYLHDGNTNQGGVSIAFTPDLPEDGEYEIFLLAPPNPNRATNAPVVINIGGRSTTVKVNQRPEASGGFLSLGRYRLPKGRKTTVTLSNTGADGYVVVDGIQFLPR